MTKQMKQFLLGGVPCLCVAFLSGCQDTELTTSDRNLAMSIVACIRQLGNEYGSQSRYIGNEPGSIQFGQGDRIGVIMDDADAVGWTCNGSDWVADEVMFWPDKTEEHTFYAYYPYAEATVSSEVPMPSLKVQQGGMSDLGACDFLAASTRQAYGTDGVVVFSGEGKAFTHVSSLLKLTFKGDGDLQASTLDKITISGKDIVAPSTYSFIDKKVTLSSDENSDILESVLAYEMNASDATFYFILNAKSDESSVVSLSVEYTTDGTTYVASMDNFAGNVFVGGMQQSYTIRIRDSYLIVSGAEIVPWGTGETLDNVVINGSEKE